MNKKGLPSLFVINEKIMAKPYYVKKLTDISKDASKHANMKNTMAGRAFYEVLRNDIFIQNEIKHIFWLKPIFMKYAESDEIYKNLSRIKIPNP